jgi:hypothetical protein
LGASGHQLPEEILEEGEVADLPQRAYVALQIGLQLNLPLALAMGRFREKHDT